MKKVIFVLVIGILAVGTISAQVWGAQSVTIEGTLQLQNGQIAVATGNTAYFVPVLTQYIGFIEGLREGARITVSGYVSGNVMQAAQVTISGKTYDFPTYGGNFASGNGYGGCGGWCYGPGYASAGNMGRRW